MNTMGCSFLILAAAALVVSFIPILNWITLTIALPMSLAGVVAYGNIARKRTAQPADKMIFWIAVALLVTITFRLIAL